LGRLLARGVFGRFTFHALRVGDAIELFSPESFGLNEDWDDLRKAYRAIGGKHPTGVKRPDFKKWLRDEKGARISTKTVDQAVRSLDALSDDLLGLLHAIENAVGLADLARHGATG
jgi:hypothetical protein